MLPGIHSEQADWHWWLPFAIRRRFPFRALGLLGLLTLAACVVVPRTTTSYNEDCQIVEKQLNLDVKVLAKGFPNCSGSGNGCVYVAAVYAGVAAGSAVVSGSIVLVGNTVYWLEEQGRCDWPAAAKLKKLPESWRARFLASTPEVPPVVPVSAETGE